MHTRGGPHSHPAWSPAWFLGRHASLYVERYTPAARRRDRRADDGERDADSSPEHR